MSSSTDRVVVGRIGKPHGLHGESTVVPFTDDPGRFSPGAVFHGDDGREFVVATAKPYRDRGLLVRFEGITSRKAAEAVRGSTLSIDAADRRDLDDDEFWEDDLVGLSAVSPDGEPLGTITAVDFGPGQHRLVVTTADGDEVLVPFVSQMVGDPDGGAIVIDAPEGLFP